MQEINEMTLKELGIYVELAIEDDKRRFIEQASAARLAQAEQKDFERITKGLT